MIKNLLLVFFLIVFSFANAKDYQLLSPDQKIKAIINVEKVLTYSLFFNDVCYLHNSEIGMVLDNGKVLGRDPSVTKESRRSINNLSTPMYGINKEVKEQYNELKIDFKDNYSMVFRAYNEGFAWRIETNMIGDIVIESEKVEFNFADNYSVYFHPSISESFYRLQKISDSGLHPNFSSLPVLLKPDNGINILIHESEVLDYPCLHVESNKSKPNSLCGSHSLYPKSVEPGGYNNFNLVVKETEDFIAKMTGKRIFPWRILAFEEYDKDILNNEIVYLLASESQIPDEEWIKPGKVAWDWWNAMNLTGVAFNTGINTETYKHYIDFAARNNIEYINIDDGWSDWFDLTKVTEGLDMQEVTSYAKSKNIGIFLWCVWWVIDQQMTEALDLFQKWGIKGIKVDFMDRDDQVMVAFHERLLKEAAKRDILVNYHGAYHPTGMSKTYPNNINVEGVRGLEWNKFNSEGVTPDHEVTIPFIRMFAGSMDYTPGAMENYNKGDWKQVNNRPMSQGTRCHQLSMFIIYYGALQMLCDSPTAYEKEPDYLSFLSKIPTVWDETYPLDSKVGEFVSVARRKEKEWYVGGMTNWEERNFSLELDFLEPNMTYEVEIFCDGVNADRVGSDYLISRKRVREGERIDINMVSGGGFAMRLTPSLQSETIADVAPSYKVVMFGNSLIEGGGSWNQKLGRDDVKNSGRGGFTTSHFVWLLEKQVIRYQPEIVILEGGINDIGVGIPIDRIKQNYQSMVDTLLSKNIDLVLQLIIYTDQGNEAQNNDQRRMIDEINHFLKDLATTRNISYIDMNPLLSEKGRLKKTYTTDGVHLTDEAYKIWSEEIKKQLKIKKI